MQLAEIIKEKKEFKKLKESFLTKTLSHAFLVIGADAVLRSAFCEEAAKLICGEHNIADKQIYKSFAVAESSDLIKKTNLKPMLCDNKCFVIDAGELSAIVQNKILKTLEEPHKNTFFFLTGVSEDAFLPTIKSRTGKIVLKDLSKKDFENLNLSEFFEKSGGSLLAANMLQQNAFAKRFELVLKCLRELKKSSQAINFSKRLATTRDELAETLNIFEMVFKQLLHAKTKKQKFWDEAIDNEFNDLSAALIVELILRAKIQLRANCSTFAIIDELLFKILEIKYKCKKVF